MLAQNALAVLPFLALALGGPLSGRNPQFCNTGPVQCCQSVQSGNSPLMTALSGLLEGIPLLSDGQVGLACTALTGAGSSVKCGSNPVCCNDTRYNGLINLGCTSMSLA